MQTFDSVYENHRDVVLRFAIHCVGRRDIAEELTADAFLELHQNWKTIDVDRLPAWLLTVVRNRSADYWRRLSLERRHLSSEARDGYFTARDPYSGLFDNQLLKPVHRLCLTLRYAHEMTLKEIADLLGLSEMQVKGHLQYARALLGKQLKAERPV